MKSTILTLFFLFVYNCSYAQLDVELLAVIKSGDTLQVEKALNAGGKLHSRDQNGANILMWSAYLLKEEGQEMLRYLVDKGAKAPKSAFINKNSSAGYMRGAGYFGSLQAIGARYSLDLLRFFIEEMGLPVNEREMSPETLEKTGWTPLEYACNSGNLPIFNYLIEKGARPDETSIALSETIKGNHTALFDRLLSMENIVVDGLDHETSNNQAPIHFAATRNVHYLTKLIEAGANVNQFDGAKKTALMHAINAYNYLNIYVLRKAGADLMLQNHKGKVAIEQARASIFYRTKFMLDPLRRKLLKQYNYDEAAVEKDPAIKDFKVDSTLVRMLQDDYEGTLLRYADKLPKMAGSRDWNQGHHFAISLIKIGLPEAALKLRLRLTSVLDTAHFSQDKIDVPKQKALKDNAYRLVENQFILSHWEAASQSIEQYLLLPQEIYKNPPYRQVLVWRWQCAEQLGKEHKMAQFQEELAAYDEAEKE